MIKRFIVLLGAAALLASACGGSDPEPRSYEVKESACQEVPITVPGITILSQRVDKISDVKVCVEAGVVADVVPTVVDQPDCGSPCFTVEVRDLIAAAETKIEVSYKRGSAGQVERISYQVPKTGVTQPIERTCVLGVGDPDPCVDRITTPKSLTATAMRKQRINLSWQASKDTGGAPLVGYEIWRSETGDEGSFALLQASETTSFQDTGLTKGQQYWYYVVAIDGDGNRSAASGVASATAR